ncbi:twin-arginine translocase subunit TatC [Rickettsiales endosymbiont of Stachyamoeba lipophora]|uniref:twin-arginine translocase subunit TatC n=1 Tax=Rickettsiales endosymbiont of Stachyamoeba lipophora TaxID=2486578 RepID=UPI0019D1F5D1|nr:twin-arginine translocase subunit TatC [Rickettsiales endosymbiont of Stachyamoeba lipophora]
MHTSQHNNEKRLTLTEHLIELRNRLIFAGVSFLLVFGVSYYFAENIYAFLVEPLIVITQNSKMIYTGLGEAFFTYLKLASFASILVTMPIFLWQIYGFIAPGLHTNEKKAVLPFMIFTPILFWIGVLFAYYVVFPVAWEFFVSFEQHDKLQVVLEARVAEYLSIVMHLMIAFGVAFELPVLLMLLLKFDLISYQSLREKRKYAIILFFIIAAIITPPDVFSQVALALPMVILYESVILYGKFIYKTQGK